MVKGAIDSFVNSSIDQAEKVLQTEEMVDKLNKSIFKFLIAKMEAEPKLVEPGAHLIVLTRHIERLADHATNIAEDLIFYVNAEIIAHKKNLNGSIRKSKIVLIRTFPKYNLRLIS